MVPSQSGSKKPSGTSAPRLGSYLMTYMGSSRSGEQNIHAHDSVRGPLPGSLSTCILVSSQWTAGMAMSLSRISAYTSDSHRLQHSITHRAMVLRPIPSPWPSSRSAAMR